LSDSVSLIADTPTPAKPTINYVQMNTNYDSNTGCTGNISS